jgi:Tol biopolymer transport system component
VTNIAWSPDGNMLASGSYDNSVIIWNASTGAKLAVFNNKQIMDTVYCVTWSPDGTLVAIGLANGSIYIMDVEEEKLVYWLYEHGRSVTGLAWSPDGKELASGSLDGTVILWDTVKGESIRYIENRNKEVSNLAWSPDGNMVMVNLRSEIIIWDPASGEVLQSIDTTFTRSAAWSPDGKILAYSMGDDPDEIYFWDVSAKQQVMTSNLRFKKIYLLEWAPDGKTIAIYGDFQNEADGPLFYETIQLDATSGEQLRVLSEIPSEINCLKWSPDGTKLAICPLESENIIQLMKID